MLSSQARAGAGRDRDGYPVETQRHQEEETAAAPAEEFADYVVETDGCDWGCYSFSLNMERPYNEIPLPAINGNVLPPTGLKTDGSCSSKCAAPGFDIIQPS